MQRGDNLRHSQLWFVPECIRKSDADFLFDRTYRLSGVERVTAIERGSAQYNVHAVFWEKHRRAPVQLLREDPSDPLGEPLFAAASPRR